MNKKIIPRSSEISIELDDKILEDFYKEIGKIRNNTSGLITGEHFFKVVEAVYLILKNIYSKKKIEGK